MDEGQVPGRATTAGTAATSHEPPLARECGLMANVQVLVLGMRKGTYSLGPRLPRPLDLGQFRRKASVLKRPHVVKGAVQPALPLIGKEQDRHPVMHRLDDGVAVAVVWRERE